MSLIRQYTFLLVGYSGGWVVKKVLQNYILTDLSDRKDETTGFSPKRKSPKRPLFRKFRSIRSRKILRKMKKIYGNNLLTVGVTLLKLAKLGVAILPAISALVGVVASWKASKEDIALIIFESLPQNLKLNQLGVDYGFRSLYWILTNPDFSYTEKKELVALILGNLNWAGISSYIQTSLVLSFPIP